MKKTLCLLLAFVMIFTLFGCESAYEITGLENFSENACSFGLNDGLLPGNMLFLSNYPYEEGVYHYWTDGSYHKAKTFVMLYYSKSVYQEAKSVCESHYSFSPTQYKYESFTFSEPNAVYDSNEYDFSGVQMLGYNDDTCSLIFVGCTGYAFDQCETISESFFTFFFTSEFGDYLYTAINSLP